MNIADLKPYSKKVDLTVKVLEKNEPREVTSKIDSSTHMVAEALVADASGAVQLTLWDDMIEKIQIGKCYDIKNGYVSLFQNTLRMNIGRYGTIEEVQTEVEANTENNMSEKQHERQSRYGSGGFNRGSGGRGGGYGRNKYGSQESGESEDTEESE